MSNVPVVLVHGWAGSFRATWQEPGWEALLSEAGRQVVGVDLLGHGIAPKPHDSAAYSDLSERIHDAVPTGSFDAVGFSLGAQTLLRMALADPSRVRRLVLMGLGDSLFQPDTGHSLDIADAIDGNGSAEDVGIQAMANYAHGPGNDPQALAALLRRPRLAPVSPADLAVITCPVLVVLGDQDFSGAGAPVASAFPNGRLVTLRATDHFATMESFKAIDAVLAFLADHES